MTSKQNTLYWRLWAKTCKTQGWSAESAARRDERRHALHRALGLPDSHKAWNNSQFSAWISGSAHLRDEIDIRDRDRENALWTIERLRAAFILVLGADYVRSILVDWRDTEDLDAFPLSDPKAYPKEKGKLRDLENLRNTLHNRLGRVIQRIRDHQTEPGPDCPSFVHDDAIPQATVIARLMRSSRPARPPNPNLQTAHSDHAQTTR